MFHPEKGKMPAGKRKFPPPGAKMAITADAVVGKEQIDLLVERFTQTYDYGSLAEIDRQFNCHQVEDALKQSHQQILSQLRLQHRQYLEQTRARRQAMLAELSLFRDWARRMISELTRLMQSSKPLTASTDSATSSRSSGSSHRG